MKKNKIKEGIEFSLGLAKLILDFQFKVLFLAVSLAFISSIGVKGFVLKTVGYWGMFWVFLTLVYLLFDMARICKKNDKN